MSSYRPTRSGRLQSPFLNRQGRQERQGKYLGKKIPGFVILNFLGALGVLGGFLLIL